MSRYSRKDYEATAEALNDVLRRGLGAKPKSQFSHGLRWGLNEVAAEWAHIYAEDNPAFDEARFYAALNKD